MPVGRKTGGRQKGVPNKSTIEVEARCRAMIDSPDYIAHFMARLTAGTLPPMLEAMSWHYAYGKPPDSFKLPAGSGSVTLSWKSS